MSGVIGEQGFEGDEVVALHDQVAVAGFPAGQIGDVFEEVKRDVLVVIDDRVFPDPVQRGHRGKINGGTLGAFIPLQTTRGEWTRTVGMMGPNNG